MQTVVDGEGFHRFYYSHLCKTCQHTNFKRSPRSQKTEVSKATARMFDLFHCDLQDPFSGKYFSKTKYFLPMLDDVSGISMFQISNFRSDAEVAAKQMVAQMERAMGNTMKRLRCDNAAKL